MEGGKKTGDDHLYNVEAKEDFRGVGAQRRRAACSVKAPVAGTGME